MPKFLEDKLKAEYPNNPGAVYGTLNKIGAMHGNKETAKGRAMAVKHARDVARGTAHGYGSGPIPPHGRGSLATAHPDHRYMNRHKG